MKTLDLAALVALTLAAASAADARPGGYCPPWMCNGPQLTGFALPTEAKRPVVNAVTLPSGETVNLR
jgi:hypothetical protein